MTQYTCKLPELISVMYWRPELDKGCTSHLHFADLTPCVVLNVLSYCGRHWFDNFIYSSCLHLISLCSSVQQQTTNGPTNPLCDLAFSFHPTVTSGLSCLSAEKSNPGCINTSVCTNRAKAIKKCVFTRR